MIPGQRFCRERLNQQPPKQSPSTCAAEAVAVAMAVAQQYRDKPILTAVLVDHEAHLQALLVVVLDVSEVGGRLGEDHSQDQLSRVGRQVPPVHLILLGGFPTPASKRANTGSEGTHMGKRS